MRWRVVPVRYAGKIQRSLRSALPPVYRLPVADAIEKAGYAPGPVLDSHVQAALQEFYRSRSKNVRPRLNGHPFVNLVVAEDFRVDHPLMQFAFSPQVLDVADDYFHGHFRFFSIQVLYSWPTNRPPTESQLWHRDYDDSRTLHCITYLDDLTTVGGGPFVFVDKGDARRIKRSPIVRRIGDDRFERELGSGQVRTFFGKAGESVWVDSAACYHYGSRCTQPRLAMFVTFFGDKPYVNPTRPMIECRDVLVQTAASLRPDLTEAYLQRLFQY